MRRERGEKSILNKVASILCAGDGVRILARPDASIGLGRKGDAKWCSRLGAECMLIAQSIE